MFEFAVSEIGPHYAAHVSRNDCSHQRSLENHSLLVVRIIPASSGPTLRSVNIHFPACGIQNSSQVGPGSGIGNDAPSLPSTSLLPRVELLSRSSFEDLLPPVVTPSLCLSGVPWSLARGPSDCETDLGSLLNMFPRLTHSFWSPPSLPLCIPWFHASRAALLAKF